MTLALAEKVGNRRTRQRHAILEALRRSSVHPDAQWVYEQVRKEMPRISLGTVYRNLNLLVEQAIIHQVPTTGGYARFDGETTPHGHIICQNCGRIDDLPLNGECEQFKPVATAKGFHDLSVQVEVYGFCPMCPDDGLNNR